MTKYDHYSCVTCRTPTRNFYQATLTFVYSDEPIRQRNVYVCNNVCFSALLDLPIRKRVKKIWPSYVVLDDNSRYQIIFN